MARIPHGAKKVFTGIIFDVYRWPQKLYDGSTATFEKLKRCDTVVVIAVTEDGQVLIQDDEQPDRGAVRSLPAGRVDPGEQPLAAAKRELAEETGYTGDSWELWQSYEPLHKLEWTIWYFIARGVRKTGEQALDPGEKITVESIAIEELLDQVASAELNLEQLGTYMLREMLHGRRQALATFIGGTKN